MDHIDQNLLRLTHARLGLKKKFYPSQEFKDNHSPLCLSNPFRILPPELWAQVFLHIPNTAPDVVINSTVRDGVWTVTHVCSGWRALALATPWMWTEILVVIKCARTSKLNNSRLARLNLWLERSNHHPLNVHVIEERISQYRQLPLDPADPVIRRFVESSVRWETADLAMSMSLYSWKALAGIAGRLPNLKCWSIHWIQPNYSAVESVLLGNGYPTNLLTLAPKLHSIRSDSGIWLTTARLPFHQLTSLDLINFISSPYPLDVISCNELIQRCPNLEYLKLSCGDMLPGALPLPTITHHRLKSLIVLTEYVRASLDVNLIGAESGLGAFFDSLVLPSLELLSVRFRSQRAWPHQSLAAFLMRINSLSVLSLEAEIFSAQNIASYLQLTPSLQDVFLQIPSVIGQNLLEELQKQEEKNIWPPSIAELYCYEKLKQDIYLASMPFQAAPGMDKILIKRY
ncbi:hypothetical protein BDQ12DRAFT_677828 [Crucibulum laeve]|uniref:Uncharacterized protein n=1 Tax=Crucibulum laeve TaxID=68775 RepID=A0A5C3MAB0_9AGAR|nr:hypothetical protein BDQ12DRAFT_677828 [Crucibulum laeve]